MIRVRPLGCTYSGALSEVPSGRRRIPSRSSATSRSRGWTKTFTDPRLCAADRGPAHLRRPHHRDRHPVLPTRHHPRQPNRPTAPHQDPVRAPGYGCRVTSPDPTTAGIPANTVRRPSGWRRSMPVAFIAGAGVGLLGGMIGLGGAEFRLPLLIGVFGFLALQAVIVNKAMSLAVVITALPARLIAVPLADLTPHWPIVVNLLAGSLVGAWAGASWATRMRTATLHKVLAALLVVMAAALVCTHLSPAATASTSPQPPSPSSGWSPGSRSASSPPSWASPAASC